jgi:hypothetical protein
MMLLLLLHFVLALVLENRKRSTFVHDNIMLVVLLLPNAIDCNEYQSLSIIIAANGIIDMSRRVVCR